ncbi:hypothetical protein [Curtobacterium luteum]|uniref:hypothetical protein n=1 Tax=Curtobacterium luteum TaxID=33881 RepID=UPI003828D831
MTNPIRAYWWSPRRDPRTLAHELRDHAPAWLRLAPGRGRAFTNHGDELSQLVLREALGRPVRWTPLGKEDVVAIGSAMIPYLTRGGNGLIWGTGLHTPDVPVDTAARIRGKVLAIRGPLARNALGLDESTPIGDPGLIVRGLRRGLPRARRRGTVLVTHFTSHMTRSQRSAIATLRAAGARILPATLPPAVMLEELGSAEHVMSSGMHGVILAHALRTPATLVSLRDPDGERASFKYHDYHQSVGLSANVTGWGSLVDRAGRRAAHDLGEADLDRADRRIDELIEGLLAASRPLRSD